MIPIRSIHPAAAYSHTSELRRYVLQKHPPKGTTSLLTPLSRDPRRSSGRFHHKNKGLFKEKSSPLYLKHASKKAQPEPPSSAYLRKNDKDPQKPSKAMAMP